MAIFYNQKNKVLVRNGTITGSGKYYVKVRAEAPKTKYKAGKWSKIKTITIKKQETYKKNCYICGYRLGRGNGKCQTYVTDGYCFYCGELVEGGKCHVCKNATPKANKYRCYDHETGKLVDSAKILKEDGILVEGMKYYK